MTHTVFLKDKNLKPENIKQGVKIMNVTGTYEGGGYDGSLYMHNERMGLAAKSSNLIPTETCFNCHQSPNTVNDTGYMCTMEASFVAPTVSDTSTYFVLGSSSESDTEKIFGIWVSGDRLYVSFGHTEKEAAVFYDDDVHFSNYANVYATAEEDPETGDVTWTVSVNELHDFDQTLDFVEVDDMLPLDIFACRTIVKSIECDMYSSYQGVQFSKFYYEFSSDDSKCVDYYAYNNAEIDDNGDVTPGSLFFIEEYCGTSEDSSIEMIPVNGSWELNRMPYSVDTEPYTVEPGLNLIGAETVHPVIIAPSPMISSCRFEVPDEGWQTINLAYSESETAGYTDAAGMNEATFSITIYSWTPVSILVNGNELDDVDDVPNFSYNLQDSTDNGYMLLTLNFSADDYDTEQSINVTLDNGHDSQEWDLSYYSGIEDDR